MVKEEKGDRCDLKKINYNNANSKFFFQFQRSLLVLFAQGVYVQGYMSQGISVPGVIVQGVSVRGVYVLGVNVRGVHVRGVYVLEPYPCMFLLTITLKPTDHLYNIYYIIC